MKLYLVLALCAVAAAAPSLEKGAHHGPVFLSEDINAQDRNILVNALVRQLINFLRRIVNNGSTLLNIPPLDPLKLDEFKLVLPLQLINLDLDLKRISMYGLGDFEVHTSDLNLRDMTFEIEISVPQINIGAEDYELVGDFYSAIPLFGKGQAKFQVDGFTFRGKAHLKQSEDGKAIIFEKIEGASFSIPKVKSQLTGVIGGGDVDAIVNAVTEDVIVNYLNRFQTVIASIATSAIVTIGNPILEKLDTWRFIAPLVPRSDN